MNETGSTTMPRETQTAGDQAVLTIGGEPRSGAAGTYPVHNPARPAEIVGLAPAADSAQLDAACLRDPAEAREAKPDADSTHATDLRGWKHALLG